MKRYLLLAAVLLAAAGPGPWAPRCWARPAPAPPAPPGPAPGPAPAPGGPSVALPDAVTLRPGRMRLVRAVSSGPPVKWVNLDEAELDLIPQATGGGAIVSGVTPGKYRVMALVAEGSALAYAICVVTVAGPAPPAPGPGPGPAPPGPGPAPSDPLARALQAAFLAELSPDRAAHLRALAALYRQAAATAADPNVVTWGKLFQAVAAAARTLGVAGQVPAVQGVVQAEMRKVLPLTSGLRMDPAARDLAAKTFLRIALALEAVK